MARRARRKKPKAVKVQFIPINNEAGIMNQPYRIMARIVATDRADLVEATVGLLWHFGWKKDRYGLLKLGCCRKRSDADRELAAYDFVIELNSEAWHAMGEVERERLIRHELEHAQLEFDDNGDAKRDERGRLICHVRQHDVAEFRSILERYGLDDDLNKIAQAAIADAQRPLLKGAAERVGKNIASEKGVDSVTFTTVDGSVTFVDTATDCDRAEADAAPTAADAALGTTVPFAEDDPPVGAKGDKGAKGAAS